MSRGGRNIVAPSARVGFLRRRCAGEAAWGRPAPALLRHEDEPPGLEAVAPEQEPNPDDLVEYHASTGDVSSWPTRTEWKVQPRTWAAKPRKLSVKATGDAKTEADGKSDQAEGKVQNAVGGVKDALRGK
jgi:hypothetical protein